jgi:hypothetical protein
MRPELDDSPDRWRVWQLAVRPHYLAAVCAARGEDAPPRFVLREIVPLARESIVDITLARATD